MTGLANKLQQDLTAAMKDKDQLRVATLRMAIAAVKEAAVSGDRSHEPDDVEIEALLRAQVKRRDEAAEAFRAGNRDAQADRELAERAILASYLPQDLSDDELEQIVDDALAAGDFQQPSDMGPAMKAVMAAVAGRAEGKRVSGLVKQKLQRGS